MIQTCLDFSLSLSERVEALQTLQTDELDQLIELLGSAYMVHPTKLVLEFIHFLILYEKIDILRRIRVAETCDLYNSILYMFHTIKNTDYRIHVIESCSNPWLKVQAYYVLYTAVKNTEEEIQIMKNLFQLFKWTRFSKIYLDWFVDQMENENLAYKHQTDCADIVLMHTTDNSIKERAKKCLGISKIQTLSKYWEHRENVHLFVPRIDVLKYIVKTFSRTNKVVIYNFIESNHYNLEFFTRRIVNDQTKLLPLGITLIEVCCLVWSSLSDDLKHLLIQDLESNKSTATDESNEWNCTTGYYHRILNIFQAAFPDLIFETEQFSSFKKSVNRKILEGIGQNHKQEDILIEMTFSEDTKRIHYLTFKATHFPEMIESLKREYPNLTPQEFDEYFSNSIRSFEDAL
jgi:hypothetical protein